MREPVPHPSPLELLGIAACGLLCGFLFVLLWALARALLFQNYEGV